MAKNDLFVKNVQPKVVPTPVTHPWGEGGSRFATALCARHFHIFLIHIYILVSNDLKKVIYERLILIFVNPSTIQIDKSIQHIEIIFIVLILIPCLQDKRYLLLPWVYVLILNVLYETGSIALLTTVHMEREKVGFS